MKQRIPQFYPRWSPKCLIFEPLHYGEEQVVETSHPLTSLLKKYIYINFPIWPIVKTSCHGPKVLSASQVQWRRENFFCKLKLQQQKRANLHLLKWTTAVQPCPGLFIEMNRGSNLPLPILSCHFSQVTNRTIIIGMTIITITIYNGHYIIRLRTSNINKITKTKKSLRLWG